MSQHSFVSFSAIRELIDNVSASFAKSKALAAVAVSCDLADYNAEIISDYLNAMMQFNEEGLASLADLQNYFLSLANAENKLYEVKA